VKGGLADVAFLRYRIGSLDFLVVQTEGRNSCLAFFIKGAIKDIRQIKIEKLFNKEEIKDCTLMQTSDTICLLMDTYERAYDKMSTFILCSPTEWFENSRRESKKTPTLEPEPLITMSEQEVNEALSVLPHERKVKMENLFKSLLETAISRTELNQLEAEVALRTGTVNKRVHSRENEDKKTMSSFYKSLKKAVAECRAAPNAKKIAQKPLVITLEKISLTINGTEKLPERTFRRRRIGIK
jgi:hypothetical protein